MRRFATFGPTVSGVLAALLLFGASGAAHAQQQQWGSIKGQVVLDCKIPQRAVLAVNKDQKDCLEKKKQLLSEEWVVDPKTKGVKWVYVYLIPDTRIAGNIINPIPIHPNLKGKKLARVVVDQPCCMFEPYAVAIQQGQGITFKNSMSIAHNVKVDGQPGVNPSFNTLIGPNNGKLDVDNLKAQATPIPMACSIHGWMSGWIRVFSHPYFMVTGENGEFEIKDAPAGKYRLVIWHPGKGWVVGDKEPDKFGIQIEIPANKTLDLKQFKVKVPKAEK